MASVFESEPLDFHDQSRALSLAFEMDKSEAKILMSRAAMITEIEEPWTFEVVQKVENVILMDKFRKHDYLPPLGLQSFSQLATEFVLGAESSAVKTGRCLGVQTLSGTGGIRLAAELLHRFLKCNTFYVSQPCVPEHTLIFENSCFKYHRVYRYWDEENKCLDFDGLVEDLEDAPEHAVILLFASGHNPTGCDPSREEWTKIADIIQSRNLIPVFECVFLGLNTGSLDGDAWPVRYFVERGIELLCIQSFSKSFGLYSERVGCLTIVANSKEVLANLTTQLTMIVSAMYSSPPSHGARIISTILGNEMYLREWLKAIQTMSEKLKYRRLMLRGMMEAKKIPGNWEYLTNQTGPYTFLGLNETQVKHMMKRHHIYMFSNGRVDLGSLSTKRMKHFVTAVSEVLKRH